ncbi:MAG: hypothetical protein M1830_007584 [Pleopsidium flavum]|nr:MAG: hypothetical protein M1830_007584 [Pleopsidium flavum]
MSSSHRPHEAADDPLEDEDAMLDPAEAAEEIPEDPDHPMESASDEGEESDQEIQLQNDSTAHFDLHKDSIFCISQHPIHPNIVATGGGDDTAYIFDSTPPDPPLLPTSYESNPQPAAERGSLKALAKLEGHTDSVNAVTFTIPRGEYVLSAGLDGRLRAYRDSSRSSDGTSWTFVAEVQEVQEISWVIPCPHPSYPNTVALGASDGSVWVYTVNAEEKGSELGIVQAFYLHTESCTAGSWTPDGKTLATVSEDGSLYGWDVFGEASAAGIAGEGGGQSVVALTGEDQRFAVEGGLYSVAVSPSGAFVVVGGAGGNIKVVGLPRIGSDPLSATAGAKGGGAKNKAGGGKKAGGQAASASGIGQAGQILASLQAQSDGIESLAFSQPPLTLLAAGSVDGSIALFDTAHRFAVRRHIRDAHEDFAVVKLEFVSEASTGGWLLTSAGMDGVVRRWDTRGGTAAAGQGLVGEWKGHKGDGEGGGVLGFVQGGGDERIVTAGDDGVALVFSSQVA